LAICVAQSFQFISLQASQSAKSRDKAEVARQGLEQLAREPSTQKNARAKQVLEHKQENYVQQWKDRFFQVVQRVKLGDAWQSRSHCWQFCWLVPLQLVRLKAGPLSKAYTLLSFQ
jgi:hypothetical protein